MPDEYGDPETDLDAAVLDQMLREAFDDVSGHYAGSRVEAATHVTHAVAAAWPNGHPPAADELGADAGLGAFDPVQGFLGVGEDHHDSSSDHVQHAGTSDVTSHRTHEHWPGDDSSGGHLGPGQGSHGGGFDQGHHDG